MLGLVGDLFAEVVALAKDLAAEVDDVLGVGVVLGEDERLRHERAAGEQLGLHDVAVGAQDGADLVGHDDGAVEVGGRVIEIVGEDCLPGLARGFAAVVDEEALVHLAAGLVDLGFDAIDVVADIHAIGDGAFMVVFGDAVLVEIGDGLRRGRGGEPDERGVEVFEHLPPEIVDGAVAFVGDDVIEHLDGDGGIVGDVAGAGDAQGGGDFRAREFVPALVHFLPAQDRVKPLDGANGDAADVVDVRRGEVLDVVEFGEEAAGVGRAVAVELVAGLLTEIRAVHEKEDAAGLGVFDEAIGEGAGGECFPRTGGHVDERARAVLGEGLLQAGDGLDLALAHAQRGERMSEGHLRESGAQGVGLSSPFGERLGTMKGEDAAGAGSGIAFVAEESFDAGGFVEERERARQPGGEEVGQVAGRAPRLIGDDRERGAFLLRLEHAESHAVHEQEIVTRTGLERHFAQRNPPPCGEVHRLEILHHPAARSELRVDLLAGPLFWRQVRHEAAFGFGRAMRAANYRAGAALSMFLARRSRAARHHTPRTAHAFVPREDTHFFAPWYRPANAAIMKHP